MNKAEAQLKKEQEMVASYNRTSKHWEEMLADLEKKHERYVRDITVELEDLTNQLHDVRNYINVKKRKDSRIHVHDPSKK